MTNKYCMRYEVYSLVDITETNARFDKNNPDWHQQQNYMTFLQTVGLRANPIVLKGPSPEKKDIKDLGFGTLYKGKHNVWEFEFDLDFATIEYDVLVDDFDLVPVINKLDETIKMDNPAFQTKDPEKINLIFKCVD